jgi:catechol 2,3-dioxygenase-like lactoylglutathione lyase family enzyme
MLAGIDHVVLVVRDIETTIAFYRNVLGCRVLREAEWRRGEVRFPSPAVGPRQVLNLHQAGMSVTPEADNPRIGSLDLCFVASEPLRAVVDRLQGKHVRIELGPVPRVRGRGMLGSSVYFRDPDRNLVEVMAYPDAHRSHAQRRR